MTVSTTTARSGPYAGSGTTGPFTVGFRFLENSHIKVVKNVAGVEEELELDVDYTVTGAGASSGSVTLGTALATGQTLTIVRNVPTTQETDYVAGDSFPAESHERALDQLTMIAQQLKEEVDRSAKLPVSNTEDANALVADIVRLADSADELDAVAAIVADVTTVAGVDTEVTTVAGIAANVTTVAGIAANVTSVAGNASNINTVAGVSSNVTTVAGVSSAVTTVAGISAAVSTVAADGTDIGAVAAISVDVQAVADIASDVSAVENIAANVTTVAGISSNVTTVAGIAANVTTVAGVSAAVSTVATNIASVNSAATNMAAIIAAPTEAANAASSASSAAASAAAAASSLDSFDDRYLGPKSSDPTLDNDGNALVTGALYYNTTTQTMKVYDGANWITATAAGTTAMNVYKYVATAGQTTFSGAAAVGGTMSYTSGNIIVFVNGVSLDSTDYTATNGTSVVLGVAARVNDEVVVVAFKSFTVADTYTQAAADALLATKVSLTGNETVAGVKTFSSEISAPNTFGFKNKLINGNMTIDQRNAGASITPTTLSTKVYTVDRFYCVITQASKISIQQNAGSVTPPAGYKNYVGITSLSSYSVTSSDIFIFEQNVEGLNFYDMAWGTSSAAPVTLSFWVRSSLTGTFGGSLRNTNDSRNYAFSYTINAANTWEQKSITIAGDTTGTWLTDSGVGVKVGFSLGSGSTYSGAAGSWGSSVVVTTTGATSVVGTNGATLYFTGVQFEKGSTATSFDYRPYGTELALCQRYARPIISVSLIGQAYSTTAATVFSFGTPMRTTPAITPTTGFNVTGASGGYVAASLSVFSIGGDGCVTMAVATASGLVAGNATYINTVPSTTILSAEL